MLGHASIYDKSDPQDGGWRVLVMRHWPRGVRKDRIDVWLRDAGPSRALLKAYHAGEVDWPEFEQRYRSEILDDRPGVLEVVRQLEREHARVTLLCHERMPPEVHCHRLVLLDLLKSTSEEHNHTRQSGAA